MAAFPLSPRLLATPLWALAEGRLRLAERSQPVLRVVVNLRSPLPDAAELARVATAEEVRGLRIRVEELQVGWAQLLAARTALERVRAAGKTVVIELERLGNAELLLASVADRVWLRPMVEMQALGLAATLRFAGDALGRLGLRFDMEAAGAYKSFGEVWTRRFASPENREATAELVADLQAELERAVAEGRKLPLEVVRAAIEEAPLSAERARELGLVDEVGYGDAVDAALTKAFGEEPRYRPFPAWSRYRAVRDALERWIEGRPRVVVLHLRGPVVDGEGPPSGGSIAAGPVRAALDELVEDEQVRAVVLAIDSPGGSATASDVIWRAVQRLQEKKPVIAAFGNVAASGGYYIAAAAAEIWAEPGTLTGSIGVVGGKVVTGEALGRLGVHHEAVLGAPHADMYRSEAPFTDAQRERFRASLQRFYVGFVDRVAGGRRQPWAAVERHARGRVWSGRRAFTLGLVDRLGGLDEAVARAGQLAGARQPARVDVYVAPRTTRLARLLRAWMEAALPELGLVPRLPPVARLLLESRGAPLLLLPFDVDIQ